MCTQPHPLIVYQCYGEEKKRTKFLKCFPDEVAPLDDIVYDLKKYMLNEYSKVIKSDSVRMTTVPCGQCYQCRLQYSRQWANRCVCESLTSAPDSCYFLTLTYDNKHLDTIKTENGSLSLNFRDLQLFLKRLRRYYENAYNLHGIRFYACGEYGEENMRPHFHVLVYNCPIPDKTIVAHNNFGDALWESDIIKSLWQFGFVCIGSLNWMTAAYTARYVMKKLTGSGRAKYEVLGITPESVRMSLKPGIGYEYLQENLVSIYSEIDIDDAPIDYDTGELLQLYNDKIILPANGDKPNIVKPPRYFDKVLERTWPSRFEDVKHAREVFAKIGEENRHNKVMKSDREYFADVEYTLNQSKKGMYRKFLDLC